MDVMISGTRVLGLTGSRRPKCGYKTPSPYASAAMSTEGWYEPIDVVLKILP